MNIDPTSTPIADSLKLLSLDNTLEASPLFDKKLCDPKNAHTIHCISDFTNLKNNSLLFIKDKKNLKTFLETYSEQQDLSIIYNEKLEKELSLLSDEHKNILKPFCFYKSTNVELSMCKLSKFVFDLIKENWNDFVDARKMGTADIHPSARVSPEAFIGKNVSIGAGTVVHAGASILSDSQIGENVEIFPQVVIYQNCHIGNGTRLHSGVVIGADGFGYYYFEGEHHKIYHSGGVILGENVEIGPNSSVDGGTFSQTLIGAGCKLDNLVQIGHNSQLGKGVIMCSQSGVAGSSSVGDFTVIGGKAGITDHIEVGAGCQIAGSAMVTMNWADKSVIGGHPARPLREWMRSMAMLKKLGTKK